MLGAPASRFWDLGQHEPQLRSTNSFGHSPRPLSQASQQLRVAECARAIRTGKLATTAASACLGVQGPAAKPGNEGQVGGAVSIGVEPATIAAICMAIAQ